MNEPIQFDLLDNGSIRYPAQGDLPPLEQLGGRMPMDTLRERYDWDINQASVLGLVIRSDK